jgi:hypothetical protein
MKISNLETAKKLSQITGRPLEDFYAAPTIHIETIDDQQAKKETVDSDEEERGLSTSDDNEEIGDNQEIKLALRRMDVQKQTTDKNSESKTIERDGEITLYTIKYGGKLSANGVVICHTKDMKRVEYNQITKKMTQKEVLNHPLLYVLFRSEEQKEGNFHAWLATFEG